MIPEPTAEDLAREATEDYDCLQVGYMLSSMAAAWIRRCVAAERERDELRKRLAVIAEILPVIRIEVLSTGTLREKLIELIHGNAGEG